MKHRSSPKSVWRTRWPQPFIRQEIAFVVHSPRLLEVVKPSHVPDNSATLRVEIPSKPLI